jgi:hypothetical protein
VIVLDLGTPAGRRRGLETLERGIPLVNRCLGLGIPTPSHRRWSVADLDDEACRDPDVYYARLLGAILDTPLRAGEAWERLLPDVGRLVPDRFRLTDEPEVLRAMRDRPEPELIEHGLSRYRMPPVDAGWRLDAADLGYVKINHAFWESVALVALRQAGLEYTRPHSYSDRFVESRFSHLVAHAIDLVHRANIADGAPPGTVSQEGAWLGVAFSNGELRAEEDLVPPIHPVARGALMGMDLVFGELAAVPSWLLADGGLAKMLFWDGALDAVLQRFSDASEVLLFVVPPHLAGTRLRGRAGRTEHLVLPGTAVHPLWPAVLPMVLGTFEELLEQGRSVGVLLQAAVMAGLAGLAVRQWRRTATVGTLRLFDLGRVLDLAAVGRGGSGAWTAKDDVIEQLRVTGPSILQPAG